MAVSKDPLTRHLTGDPYEREVGNAPISIGTSLAIESLCGFGEFSAPKPPLRNYTELWVNLRTLYRNIRGSLSTAARQQVSLDVLSQYLLGDIISIVATITNVQQSAFPIFFYLNEYQTLSAKLPLALHRIPKTEIQILHNQEETKVLRHILKNRGLLSEHFNTHLVTADLYPTRIPNTGDPRQSVILTHVPLDLLAPQFRSLTLLESHTGKLKRRIEWNSKLTGSLDISRLPFNPLTLQVFGDRQVLFNSMPLKIKKQVLEMAVRDKWTPVSTEERVRASIEKLYDPREKVFFLKLLRGTRGA